MSNWMEKASNWTISERIRKCREFFSGIKAENDDEDVNYCGTIEYDSKQVENIRNFFKPVKQEVIDEKEANSDTDAEKLGIKDKISIKSKSCKKITSNIEVKNEKEASFVINLDETNERNSKNQPKVRECRVTLKDVRKEIQNGKFCNFCNKEYYNITDHIKKIHFAEFEDLLISCNFCEMKFFKAQHLGCHESRSHPDKKSRDFICDFDGRIFKSRKAISFHMSNHCLPVKCKFCNAKVKPNYMAYHMTINHDPQRQFKCNFCPKICNTDKNLKKHEKIHNKNFECHICNKKFTIPSILRHHLRIHNNSRIYACKFCEKKYNWKSNFDAHLKTHDKDRQKKYQCQQCSYSGDRKESYTNHLKTHNKNRPKPLKCQRCDYATDMQYNFKNHQKYHERQDIKVAAMKNPLKCEKCPTFHKDKSVLSNHMRNVHRDVLNQCDLCGKYIKYKSDLKNHILLHLKDKN
jgi:hypothetical protein